MANYNPHNPVVLGNEWVPIKSAPYELDTDVERGYTFVLPTTATIVSGSVYMNDVPANVTNRRAVVSLYEEHTEHLTGPIQRVVVAPSSGIGIADSDSISSGDSDRLWVLGTVNNQPLFIKILLGSWSAPVRRLALRAYPGSQRDIGHPVMTAPETTQMRYMRYFGLICGSQVRHYSNIYPQV